MPTEDKMENTPKKKILLLATGGTIASSGKYLNAEIKIEEILKKAENITKPYDITPNDLMSLDSSEVQPEDWLKIAEEIDKSRTAYDGIVVTHGTDTMAYTSAYLSFMLCGIDIPVVFTGSQLTVEAPNTDAFRNLDLALKTAASGYPGVFVAFAGRVMLACRASKTHTTDFSAFESINYPYIAEKNGDRIEFHPEFIPKIEKYTPKMNIDSEVFLLKLTPGTKPEIFDLLVGLGYRGFVIEAFGMGGMHSNLRDLPSKLAELAKKKIPVVVKSQCHLGTSRLDVYEVGRKAESAGVVCAGNMTTESAFAKLKFLLSNGYSCDQIKEKFTENFVGEIGEARTI